MTDQNNEGWPAVLRLNDHYMEEIVGWMQADDKVSGCMTYTRADRAAPEGQVGALRDAHALTPPPAAPTDNTALVEAAYHAGIDAAANRYRVCASPDVWDYFYTAYNAMLDLKTFPMPAALASREAPPACQQETVTESDLAAARAEIERLTKERDLSKELLRSCIQGNNVLRKKAQKAIAERDEARDDERK